MTIFKKFCHICNREVRGKTKEHYEKSIKAHMERAHGRDK